MWHCHFSLVSHVNCHVELTLFMTVEIWTLSKCHISIINPKNWNCLSSSPLSSWKHGKSSRLNSSNSKDPRGSRIRKDRVISTDQALPGQPPLPPGLPPSEQVHSAFPSILTYLFGVGKCVASQFWEHQFLSRLKFLPRLARLDAQAIVNLPFFSNPHHLPCPLLRILEWRGVGLQGPLPTPLQTPTRTPLEGRHRPLPSGKEGTTSHKILTGMSSSPLALLKEFTLKKNVSFEQERIINHVVTVRLNSPAKW